MAVVGHAYVVVRAITDKVERDIRKGFEGTSTTAHKAGSDLGNAMTRGLSKSFKNNNSFTKLADQIKTLYPEADQAATSFTKLVRKGYVVQSGFGALLGSVGALVGGLGALIGVAGGAAGSVVALGGAFLTLKVGMSVAGFAMKGISQAVAAATKANGGYSKSLKEMQFDAEDATLGVEKAGIALEKAIEARNRVADLAPNNRIRREADVAVREAELALRKAKFAEENPDKPGGGADPYAGLTPAQKQFAQFLAGLKPKFDELRESAAKGFLPLLEEQMTRLINGGLLDTLRDRFYDIGQGLGIATEKFVDVFLRGNGLNNLNVVLGQIAKNLPPLGSTLAGLFNSFLTAIRAADPLTRRFIGFLESKSTTFSDFLETKRLSGELTVFFNTAGDLAARFGNVFGNIFGGLGKIISANFGPGSGGDMILQWLQDTTAGFKNMDLIGIQNYFKGAADNFIAMGNALGGALEIIVKSGSNPAIKQFYDTMDGAAYAFQEIVTGAVEASPALADILVKLIEIVAVFADSGQVKVFFGTISYFLGGIMEVLKALKPLFDGILGPIFAVVSAFGLMFTVVTKIGLVGAGMIGKLLFALGTIPGLSALGTTSLATMATAGTAAGTSITVAMAPILPIVLAIGAAIAVVAAAFGIHAANMEKASKGVTAAFEKNADATTIWNQATLASINGPQKDAIASLDGMKDGIKRLQLQQEKGGYALASTTALADSFGAMGRSLANIATTDLPKAQAQMKKFASQTGLSNREVAVAIDEMDEFKASLKEQAAQMGINIGDTDTLAGKLKLAQFAMGEGEVATRKLAEAQKDFAGKVATAASSMIDFESALTNSTKNGIIDADKFVKEMEKQFTDAAAFQTNIFALQARGFDGLAAELLAKGPEVAAKAAAALVKETDKELGKIEKTAERKGFLTSEGYKKGIESGTLLVTTAAGKLSQNTLNAFTKEFASAKTQGDLDGALARLQTAMQRAGIKIPVGVEVDPNALRDAAKKITGYVGSTFYINGKPATGRKDGGYIGKYAMGGFVSGLGTARSDSIPAMLSNGEYVINARATSQNRQLLDAINSNQSVGMGNTVQVTVNPSAKMDEKELAAEVSRQIAFNIRKGGY